MACQGGFWRGIAVGVFAGFALGRLLSRSSSPLSANGGQWRSGAAGAPSRLRLKRDDNAGDPSTLTSARTGATASFERAGGAPGGTDTPEWLEVPGRPGQRMGHDDPSRPVKPASRALKLPRNDSTDD